MTQQGSYCVPRSRGREGLAAEWPVGHSGASATAPELGGHFQGRARSGAGAKAGEEGRSGGGGPPRHPMLLGRPAVDRLLS